MATRDTIGDIEAASGALARHVREYVREQKEHWQRIPRLAYEADGKTGFSGQYADAVSAGVWRLRESTGTYLAVDCAAGELIHFDGLFRESRPASDAEILKLLPKLQAVDAASLEERLREAAEAPVSSTMDPEAVEDRRKRNALFWGVPSEVYDSHEARTFPAGSPFTR